MHDERSRFRAALAVQELAPVTRNNARGAAPEQVLAQPRAADMPNLRAYHLILLNTSGGKDSQAMLDYVVEQADASGVRERLVAVHADLGVVEWPGTREVAQRQAQHYGIRFEVVRREQGDLLQQIEARGMFPDAARRYCTSDQKRGPVLRLVTQLAADLRASFGDERLCVRVLNAMGLRAEESPARRLRARFQRNARASSGRRVVDDWLPIHAWSEHQVWARIRASGVEHHPAYDLGMPRLSCRFCILASESALVRSAQLNPELAAAYVRLEQRIGHRFRSDLSMADVVARAATAPTPPRIEPWAA